jgi:hypothetical protein
MLCYREGESKDKRKRRTAHGEEEGEEKKVTETNVCVFLCLWSKKSKRNWMVAPSSSSSSSSSITFSLGTISP